MIRELTAADLPGIRARLASPSLTAEGLRGWIAVGHGDALDGVVLDVDGRRGDLLAQHWWAASPPVFADLYAVAAEAWVAAGITTHRLVAASDDPVARALVDLGFGHQQAYASQSVGTLLGRADGRGRTPTVEVRTVSDDEVAALTSLVPLIAQHQDQSPVFAPRGSEFFEQLPASVAEYVDDPSCGAWLAWAKGSPVGFALAELGDGDIELTLVGVTPAARLRGAAAALVSSAIQWGRDRGARTAIVDWRTTNTLAAAFWQRLGFEPAEYRWARTIDLTPD